MNLNENNCLPYESDGIPEFYWLRSWYPSGVVRVTSLKYIDRLEIELATAELGGYFHELCEQLLFGHQFIVENVRWMRSEEHLAVIGATFVRFRPVEE